MDAQAAEVIERRLSEADEAALRHAVRALEEPSLTIRIANALGKPVELTLNHLPAPVRSTIDMASEKSLKVAMRAARATLMGKRGFCGGVFRTRAWHRAAVATSGAVGGAGGFATLAFELPVTTTLMLRSIAAIARAEGEDLRDPGTQMACLQVFGLGSTSEQTGASDSAYFASRAAMARGVREAVTYITAHGAHTGPPLKRLVAIIAKRFGVTVSQKAAAQAAPILGALGGASLNLMFIAHFQDLAQGHFTVRRLERTYGAETVRRHYDRIRAELAND
jgi:hypothetical protein